MFNKARIRLTLLYLLMIMLVSGAFSFVVYRIEMVEIERFEQMQRVRMERRYGLPPRTIIGVDEEAINEAKDRLILMLVFINGGILFFSGGLGYLLAGRTLKPIAVMVEEQSRFISDASHELRTPLASLKIAMEVFLRDKKTTLKDAKELVGESLGQVNRLQKLSENLLELTRLKKQNTQIVNLLEVINKATDQVKVLAKNRKIKINISGENEKVKGDKELFVNLFVILLDNAIKYSHDKGEVNISIKKTDDYVLVNVVDQGIGISQKDLPHIFDRFYRADLARSKSDSGGYGLGLSIAKQIVTMYNGSIAVKSEINKGSLFSVKLQTA